MIVCNFHIDRSRRAVRPFKANPPLVINANAVLAFSVALKRFKTVTRYIRITERCYCLKPVELYLRLVLKALEGFNPFSFGKILGSFVPEAHDHCHNLNFVICYVKHNCRVFPFPHSPLPGCPPTFVQPRADGPNYHERVAFFAPVTPKDLSWLKCSKAAMAFRYFLSLFPPAFVRGKKIF